MRRSLGAAKVQRSAAWAPTFADISALLLGLFVMLVAVSEPDLERFAVFRADRSREGGKHVPSTVEDGRTARPRLAQRLAAWSRAHLAPLVAVRDAAAGADGVWIELGGDACFAASSAQASPALDAALRDLASQFDEPLARVEVGGHASLDELEPELDRSRSVARARAATASALLRAAGLGAESWSEASYEAGLPPRGALADTPEARRAARRVTLRLEVGAR